VFGSLKSLTRNDANQRARIIQRQMQAAKLVAIHAHVPIVTVGDTRKKMVNSRIVFGCRVSRLHAVEKRVLIILKPGKIAASHVVLAFLM